MVIEKIHIKSFGTLIEKTLEPTRGMNIIEGNNECGKSTVAMFIKFAFYGLLAKAADSEVSERANYVNWSTGVAAGELTLSCDMGRYRIERALTASSSADGREQYRESVKIISLDTGESVKTRKSPGEYFFGFPEKVFLQSAFVKSIDGARVDGVSLKVALENLMTSGDEEINTKRALEKIDGARKLLKHKNGLGGRIVELSAEKRELSELLSQSQDISKQIVDLEGTVADLGVKIKRREEESERLTALCEAYEAVRMGLRIKDIEKCESAVSFLTEELGALDSKIDRSLLAKIEICRSSIEETEQDVATLLEKKAELEEKCENEDASSIPDEPDEIIKYARALKKGSRGFLAAGLVTVFVGAVAAGAVFGGELNSAFSYLDTASLAAGAIFLLLSAAFFVLFGVRRARLKALFERWNAADFESLRKSLEAEYEKYTYIRRLLEKITQIDTVITEARSRGDRERARAREIGELLGILSDDDDETAVLARAREAAEAVCEKRETMSAKLENEKGRLCALLAEIGVSDRENAGEREREALCGIDREKVLSMTKEEYAETLRTRNFADSQAKALGQRKSELEKKVVALRSAGESPADIAARISCLDAAISSLTFKYNALVTAYNALETAGEKMRGDVIPEIVKKASKTMGYVTGGKYGELTSGESLEMSFYADGERRPVDFLSDGTKDISYVSMRLALAETMYGGDTPPMIFDDCFARMDTQRLSGMLGALSTKDAPQSFVFTCRAAESKAAPEANVIRL